MPLWELIEMHSYVKRINLVLPSNRQEGD